MEGDLNMEDIPGVKWWTSGTVRDPSPARLVANTEAAYHLRKF